MEKNEKKYSEFKKILKVYKSNNKNDEIIKCLINKKYSLDEIQSFYDMILEEKYNVDREEKQKILKYDK